MGQFPPLPPPPGGEPEPEAPVPPRPRRRPADPAAVTDVLRDRPAWSGEPPEPPGPGRPREQADPAEAPTRRLPEPDDRPARDRGDRLF